jgi:hypothetical protein
MTDKVKVHVPNPGGGTTTFEVRREPATQPPSKGPATNGSSNQSNGKQSG